MSLRSGNLLKLYGMPPETHQGIVSLYRHRMVCQICLLIFVSVGTLNILKCTGGYIQRKGKTLGTMKCSNVGGLRGMTKKLSEGLLQKTLLLRTYNKSWI